MSGPRHTTYKDVDRELSSAEVLLHQVRQRRQSLSVATFVLPVIAIIGFAAAVAMLSGGHEALPLASGVAAVALALLVAGLVVNSRLRRRVATQEQQMVNAVNWVREVFPLVAEREKWTTTQTEAVRKRVARFPIAAR